MSLHLDRPWLHFDLGAPHRVLSWTLNKPGFTEASAIIWREVRNADLSADFEVLPWLQTELAERGWQDHPAFLTSRDVTAHHLARATVEGVTATCVATVGLSNAERVGHRLDRSGKDWGTINTAVQIDSGLTDAAFLETLSIVAQARTAAVVDTAHILPSGATTGTGTDCIAIAAPTGTAEFAGLHTAIGEAVGRATYDAVRRGAQEWMDTVRRPGEI